MGGTYDAMEMATRATRRKAARREVARIGESIAFLRDLLADNSIAIDDEVRVLRGALERVEQAGSCRRII